MKNRISFNFCKINSAQYLLAFIASRKGFVCSVNLFVK